MANAMLAALEGLGAHPTDMLLSARGWLLEIDGRSTWSLRHNSGRILRRILVGF